MLCWSLAILGVIKSREVKVLVVLEYMFHGSCRKVSMVLSMALEPISKSAVHYLAKKVSYVKVAKETRYRRCIAVDETKLRVKKSYVYVWSAVDVRANIPREGVYVKKRGEEPLLVVSGLDLNLAKKGLSQTSEPTQTTPLVL